MTPRLVVHSQQIAAIKRSIVPKKAISIQAIPQKAPQMSAPTVVPKEDWNMYKNALQARGITLNGTPRDPRIYKLTNDAFDNVYKGEPIKLNLNYKPGAFTCGTDTNAAGCYEWDANKNLDIRDDMNDQLFKFTLLHEYGHSTGIRDEKQADQFAQKYVPVDGWYNKIGKPLEGNLYNKY